MGSICSDCGKATDDEMMIDDHDDGDESKLRLKKTKEDDGDEGENKIKSEFFCFDVGGIKYKVSRATLELHPDCILTKMVSSTWNNGEANRTFFIDRDGGRFRYVLDFMRDGGNIHLPITESVTAICSELDYYGFPNVPEKSIISGVIDQRMLRTIEGNVYDEIDQVLNEINELDQKKEDLQNLIGAIKIANIVFIRTAGLEKNKKMTIEFRDSNDDRAFKHATKAEESLKQRLSAHGLVLLRMSETWATPVKLSVQRMK